MTRPKVPDDKRQRTAQACEWCKRRKQKCNGLKPCANCIKKSSICTYKVDGAADNASQNKGASPPKRRLIETPDGTKPGPPTQPASSLQEDKRPDIRSLVGPDSVPDRMVNPAIDAPRLPVPSTEGRGALHPHAQKPSPARPRNMRGNQDDEAELHLQTRILQTPDGRPIYLGESATLSGLQLLRVVVDHIVGECNFTSDPSRFRIMENVVVLSPTQELPGILPTLQTSEALIEAFFTNTHGLIDLFNRPDFERAAAACVNDPFIAKPKLLCLMYLTFATGLVLATPKPGNRQEPIVLHLRRLKFDVAENFFRNTTRLVDPLTVQENADFWSVQILCLMTVYMLSISRRNAAYSYLGMAVQAAITLGLHRGTETDTIFVDGERVLRRNVWRSLFVLDRFLAAALGRPTLINEDDCSPDSLDPPPGASGSTLGVAVEIAKVVGRILKLVYSRRRVKADLAQQFFADCGKLKSLLQGDLDWRGAVDPSTPVMHAISILHLNLFYSYAVILYTRPFFLYLLKVDQIDGIPAASFGRNMQKFSKECVKIAAHTVRLVHGAFQAKYLPQRNPFVIHYLFTASLIVLGNEFGRLHPNPDYTTLIANVVEVMSYCAWSDPQANRLMYIITTFRDVVVQAHGGQLAHPGPPLDERQNPTTGHNLTNGLDQPRGSFSGDSSYRASTISTMTGSAVGTPFSPRIPMGQDNPFQIPGTGASPVSTAGFSHGGGDSSTPVGEDEVNFEQFWRAPHDDSAASAMPLFQTVPSVRSRPDSLASGSFGVYSVHMQGFEAPPEATGAERGIPLYVQSQLPPDVPN